MPYCIDCGNYYDWYVGGSHEYCSSCYVDDKDEVYHATLTKCLWCQLLFETIDPELSYCPRCKDFLSVNNWDP